MTRFFNKGHPLPGAFSSDRYSISAQALNKYSAVMILAAIYFSTKKKRIITKSNSEIYDVNSLYIKYLSKISTKKP